MRENHPAWQKLRFEVVDHSEIEGKKSQRLLDAKERAREYKLELEKMRIRVESQPTLFERQSAVSLNMESVQFSKNRLNPDMGHGGLFKFMRAS